MRIGNRNTENMPAVQDARYCLLCEDFVTFEQVDTEECWMCVRCGSAICVDPPIQLAG